MASSLKWESYLLLPATRRRPKRDFMGYEVKNIKSHMGRGNRYRECFSVNIYKDGKKVGMALNDGNGGCNFYDFGALGSRGSSGKEHEEGIADFTIAGRDWLEENEGWWTEFLTEAYDYVEPADWFLGVMMDHKERRVST